MTEGNITSNLSDLYASQLEGGRTICDNDKMFIVVSKAIVEDKRTTVRIGIGSRASLGFVLNSQANQKEP